MLITLSECKLSELQKQIQHHRIYMNQGDTVQIEAPKFDPDIDRDRPLSTVEKPDEVSILGDITNYSRGH